MEKILPRPTKFTLAPELLYGRTAVRVMYIDRAGLILHQQSDFEFSDVIWGQGTSMFHEIS